MPRLALGLATLLGAALLGASPALADLRVCNQTGSRVGVAVGYKDGDGWTTEGWWNLGPRACEVILRGPLVARFYYFHAVDYDQGGEWGGRAFMCARDREFTIRGIEDCLARGYDRTGFFEVDTGDQRVWTVQLTEEAPAARPPLAAPIPAPPPPTRGRTGDAETREASPVRPIQRMTPLPTAPREGGPGGPSGLGTGVPAFTR